MMTFSKKPRGMILFFTVLILGVTATSVVFMLSQSSVNGFLSADEEIKSKQVRSELFGCLDEVLAHYAAASTYVLPATIDLVTSTCTASVVANADQRTVTLTRVNLGITRRVVAIVNVGVVPITVSSVMEQ